MYNLENIKNNIENITPKKSIKEGNIIFCGDRVGICISDFEYVTVNLERKMQVLKINSEVIEYDIAYLNSYTPFSNLWLTNSVKLDVMNGNNALYNNSYEYVLMKIGEMLGVNLCARSIDEMKNILNLYLGVKKWYKSNSLNTSEGIKERIYNLKLKEYELRKKIEQELNEKIVNNKYNPKNEEIYLKLESIFQKVLRETIIDILEDDKENELENSGYSEGTENVLQDLNTRISSDLELEIICREINELNDRIEKQNLKERLDYQQSYNNILDELRKASNDLDESSIDDLKQIKNFKYDLENLESEISSEIFEGNVEVLSYINSLLNKCRDLEKYENPLYLGWDLKPGELKKINSRFLELLKLYENNFQLKRLIDKIGRNEKKEENIIKNIEETISKTIMKISKMGKEYIKGVTFGKDVMRILPSELLYLSEEETEDIFLYKYIKGELMCYELEGTICIKKETKESKDKEEEVKIEEKGAIVAMLDTSRSMVSYIEKSRALLLQTFKIAKKDKRDMKVLLFGSRNELEEYTIDSSYSLNNFIDFIDKGFNGGTDIETPFNRAIDIVTKDKKYNFADIFIITDGKFNISNGLKEKIENSKGRLNLNLYSVIFGCNSSIGSEINKYCDDILFMQ